MATSGHESETINVSGLKATMKDAGNIGLFNEATCSTAAATAAKTVTSPTSFTLTTGATIVVKFTNAITVASATLAVGSNAAKAIYYRGAALAKDMVKAGDRLILRYNGTQFDIIGHLDTDTNTQAVSSVVGQTGAVTATQIGTALTNAGYKLTDNNTWNAASTSQAGYVPAATKGKFLHSNASTGNLEWVNDNNTTYTPQKLGTGIGTCSTSSGTALTVSLSGYELVKNGFVAVTFSNDVPANATLNINGKGAKNIIYKGAAIEADTIKADDTALFSYDGTNYVLCSSGAGSSAPVSLVEYLSINLTSNEPSQASVLIGTTVVITDEDNDETILSTTWQGTTIECEIDVAITYKITVGDVNEYTTPVPRTFKARAGYTRVETFKYKLNAYVNLGLPSGTKWALGNIVPDDNEYKVGAETDYGAYVSWGNVTPHFSSNGSTFDDGYSFSSDNYNNSQGAAITGPTGKGATFAPNSGYDAARELLGSPWRMPTADEWKELNDNCSSVWTTKNGINGREFTSNINGNKIFIPAGGAGIGTNPVWIGQGVFYWSSSLCTSSNAYNLNANSGSISPQDNTVRTYGALIRAVQ